MPDVQKSQEENNALEARADWRRYVEMITPTIENFGKNLVKTSEVTSNALMHQSDNQKEMFAHQLANVDKQHERDTSSQERLSLDQQKKKFIREMVQLSLIALVLLAGIVRYLYGFADGQMVLTHSFAVMVGYFAGHANTHSRGEKNAAP